MAGTLLTIIYKRKIRKSNEVTILRLGDYRNGVRQARHTSVVVPVDDTKLHDALYDIEICKAINDKVCGKY